MKRMIAACRQRISQSQPSSQVMFTSFKAFLIDSPFSGRGLAHVLLFSEVLWNAFEKGHGSKCSQESKFWRKLKWFKRNPPQPPNPHRPKQLPPKQSQWPVPSQPWLQKPNQPKPAKNSRTPTETSIRETRQGDHPVFFCPDPEYLRPDPEYLRRIPNICGRILNIFFVPRILMIGRRPGELVSRASREPVPINPQSGICL